MASPAPGNENIGAEVLSCDMNESTTVENGVCHQNTREQQLPQERQFVLREQHVYERYESLTQCSTKCYAGAFKTWFKCSQCARKLPLMFYTPSELRKKAKRRCHQCAWEALLNEL